MKDPPHVLQSLYFGDTERSKHFLSNIRRYNNMFCFTSLGGRVDRSLNTGTAPPLFRISGQNYHYIGSLVPTEGSTAKFAQLYIYDTDNEINNRIILSGRRNKDGRTYNLLTAHEVAALIVGDLDASMGNVDILIETRTGQLKRINQLNPAYLPLQYRINQLNPAYLPLQYPLLFPYGEDGYREDIMFSDAWREHHHGGIMFSDAWREHHHGGRIRISPKEYFSFYIHEKVNEKHTLLYSRRLFQQYLVDAYTMIESARLTYIRTHQKVLRCEAYQGLSDALTRGELDPRARGKRIILPPSFTGGARYMIQNYQDAMAICKHIGYPHIFITFTSNPKWPEIERYVAERGLKAEDRPNIVCRVFKIKLDAMIEDIKIDKLFGEICGVIYTIEFQKRGLPHAHILLFAKRMNRANSAKEIDALISTEIPDPDADVEYHEAVIEFMFHGPCGVLWKNSPCMVDGNDRVTTEFMSSSKNALNGNVVDEINMYYDCRYISTCEATWRLFGYVIHYRTPPVERLNFHLEHQQNVVYSEDQPLDEIVENQTVKQSQFKAWFEANKKYEDARSLTYAEFPSKFVWRQDLREWHPRKRGYSIGRLFYVPPGCGELYYLRCLLNLVRGPFSHEDIRTVAGVIHNSFRDACYEYGLLDDDKEYIDGIIDSSYWASAYALRRLFVTLLTSSSLSKPEVVWNAVWEFLAEDAQVQRRRVLQNPELMLSDSDKKQFALMELENLLSSWGKSLKDFPEMPIPDESSMGLSENMLIAEELAYDKESLM
ncbi:uncharacterized protein LOC116029903 [Ipomoea triloba]|uniref:uncharacterized protein LOC116029903 n=1 Tax=Ipomoea triloba TaxID=35885 RepID=UPI00125D7EF2|nr:uncharacterized protein LOC116029903 [Ipomoea triloba]